MRAHAHGSRLRRTRMWIPCAVALLLASTGSAQATTPEAPETLSYQGVLLDAQGDPRSGPLDLTVRVFDSLTGGTLLYLQTVPNVVLTDGSFTIRIGPTGAGTDLPVDPLTTSLLDAFVLNFPSAGMARFLELTVGTEGSLGRTQALSTPYALHAALADVAVSAQSVDTVDASFLTEIFEHGNSDNSGPPNSDPQEGLADTDGDGIANFVDPDNDNDTFSDSEEIAQGSDINLVTPIVSSFSPIDAPNHVTTTVTVQGANFDPGLSVNFGSQSPTPGTVTATSFEVAVGPQAVGAASVIVSLPNGETGNGAFPFFLLVPSISSFTPPSAFGFATTRVTVTGQNFEPGLTVDFGSETPAALNVTSTGFEVDVGPQASGNVQVVVTVTNWEQDSSIFSFGNTVPHTGLFGAIQHVGLAVFEDGRTLLGAGPSYHVDTDGGGQPDLEVSLLGPLGGGSNPSQLAVAWDPLGAVAGIRCREVGADCVVEVYRDADGDFLLEPGEATVIETILGPTPRIWSPSLTFDPSGNLVAGYLRVRQFSTTVDPVVLHDLNGDGSFAGVDEITVIESLLTGGIAPSNAGKVAVDPSGRVAYAWGTLLNGNQVVRVAYDLDGDRSFDDTPGGVLELNTVAAPGAPVTCVGTAFDVAGRLAVVYASASTPVTVLRDLNASGAFGGVAELQVLESGTTGEGCDVAGSSFGGLSVAWRESAPDSLLLAVDRNENGIFSVPTEILTLSTVSGTARRVAVAQNSTGRAFVADGDASGGTIFVDPIP